MNCIVYTAKYIILAVFIMNNKINLLLYNNSKLMKCVGLMRSKA